MFNPLKAASNFAKGVGDTGAMMKQALAIQQALEKEEFEVVSGNVRIVINGNQKVKTVEIDGVYQENVKNAVNDAIKKSQQAAAGKLQELSKTMG